MNHRLELQLTKVARVLPLLAHTHTPVYRIELDAHHAAPRLHTGAGPFGWNAIGFGVDDQGAWTDYVAHLRGVELVRRTRRSEVRATGRTRRSEVRHA